MIAVPMTVSVQGAVKMSVGAQGAVPMSAGAEYKIGGQQYRGAYEFTPTSEAQTIEAQDCFFTRDIVINPIPNNYGLITYNGSVITVS